MDSGPPSKPRLCRLQRGADGYGFNLHGEKGQHGQYIRAVDEGSAADLSGLRSGDRVIEVDGVNIERETHSQVVARIRAGGDQTCLLVVDRELDAYCRKQGITIKESMVENVDESPRINGQHEVEVEVQMNGDISENNVEVGELITAKIDMTEESAPERDEEEEEERREEFEERVEDAREEDAYPEVTAEAETGEAERRVEVKEELFIQAERADVEESIPDMAPPTDRDDDLEGSVPEPEPEPVLEAATVPLVESAPPPAVEETDGAIFTKPEPEPERAPTPEPVRAPTPEPVRAPTPEPVRAPTPEPVRVPTPEPVKKIESAPPPRPNAAPTQSSKSGTSGLDLSDMDKARILAAGRKKKKAASSKNWEDKYAAFNNL